MHWFLVYISKFDRRYKAGKRLVGTYPYARNSTVEMDREVRELMHLGYSTKEYDIVYYAI